MNTSKRSRQRDAILAILKSTNSHPTADWIYAEVKKTIPNISLGTVYRNLSKLSEEGLVVKLGLGTGVEHFDGVSEPHYHVICSGCGTIFDIIEEPLIELNTWAKERFSGEIYKHSTVFYGKCGECNK